ncbi:MAG TPA: hypothetical protein VMD92_19795 [Acidobacteriaceae bacterium]|nr:hypothetical protein [Acidobacteriaceae bacterium]
MIAIELAVLSLSASDDAYVLSFTKVLDIYQSPDVVEEQTEVSVNRLYWEGRSSPEAMAVFDRFIKMLASRSLEPKLNYRQDGIALAGKWNFTYIQPVRDGECLVKVSHRIPEDFRKDLRERLEQAGVGTKTLSRGRFVARLSSRNFDRSADALADHVRCGLSLTVDSESSDAS